MCLCIYVYINIYIYDSCTSIIVFMSPVAYMVCMYMNLNMYKYLYRYLYRYKGDLVVCICTDTRAILSCVFVQIHGRSCRVCISFQVMSQLNDSRQKIECGMSKKWRIRVKCSRPPGRVVFYFESSHN